MKRIIGIGFLSMSLIANVVPATAADDWYVNLSAGGGWMPDVDYDVPVISPIKLTSTSSFGPIVMGSIGKKFSSGLRVEGELSYRTNDFDDIKATGTTTVSGVTITGTGVPVALTGDMSSLGFMANVGYDFAKGGKFRPYVLAGLGGANVSINDAKVDGLLLADDSDFVFAYQVGVGLDYQFTEKVSLGLSYRFFGVTDPSFTGSDNTTKFDTEYMNHSILAGITYEF